MWLVGEITGSMGASPQIGEMLPLCDFFYCPVLSLPFCSILLPGRTAGVIVTLYGSNDVFVRKDGLFVVQTMGGGYMGKYAPNPQKWARKGNFKQKHKI